MNQLRSDVDLLVGVCLTKTDWLAYKKTLIPSFQNIVEAWQRNVIVFVVLQGNEGEHISITDLPDYLCLFEVDFMGVSNARNLCVKRAVEIGAEFILFHDASIFWPKKSASFIAFNRTVRPKVKVKFSDFSNERGYSQTLDFDGRQKKVNPIYDAYVWSYLLKVSDVAGVEFNEAFGPGINTRFKSGEDVLFLFDYLNEIKCCDVLEADDCYVFHPKRSSSYDKHLTYASGQGKIFRLLLAKYPSFVLYRDLILFFCNAIMRCVLGKPNSFQILKHRVIGFFDRGIN
ncbi:hypothetical protein ACE02Z_02545 [Shewanella xiamenensis]|uniref:hypothetical protein n=1 Tax=Shewanella xiamenensis TaxID=332186 RepID=UPI00313CDB07